MTSSPRPILCHIFFLGLLVFMFAGTGHADGVTSWSSLVPTWEEIPVGPNDIQRAFPAPNGQTIRSLVRGPVGGGVFPMRPINSGELPDQYFPAAVNAAIQAGVHKLLIPKGAYNFNPTQSGQSDPNAPHWLITDISDLEIDGQGSTLNFSEPRDGIRIQPTNGSVARIRLRNFIVDWPKMQFAALGTITAGSGGQMNLQIDSKYQAGANTPVMAVNVWDTTNNTWSLNTTEVDFGGSQAPPAYIGNSTYSSAALSSFAAGTRVLVRNGPYNGVAVAALASNDIDIESVTVLASPGQAFYCTGAGDRGFRLAYSSVRRGAGRLISTTSDGLDVIDFLGDIQIENNEISFQGDNALVIYETYYPVAAVSGTQVTIPGELAPNMGDTLAFFDPNLVFQGSALIQSVAAGNTSDSFVVTLDQAVSGVTAQSVAANLTEEAPARYIIQYNRIHDHRATGTLVGGAYGLVNHNIYQNNTFGAIQAGAIPTLGPGTDNLIIANNSVSNSGDLTTISGAVRIESTVYNTNISASPSDQHIVLSNNTVMNEPGPAFIVASVSNASLFGNVVTNSNQGSAASSQNFGSVSTSNSTIVYGASQVNLCGTMTSGTTTGPVGVDAGSTSAVAIDAAGCSSSPIVGYLDGFGTDAYGNTTVTGWACATGWQNPVMVQVFAVGNQSDGGTLLNFGMASAASSTDINNACSTTGAAHTFSLPIPRGLQKQLVGKPVYIFGLSPVGAGDTPIGNSGSLMLSDPTGTVTGHIEGIFVSDGQSYVTGWACAFGMPDAIDVHYYSGGPAGTGQFVDAYTANLPSEPNVSGACGDSTDSPHRFMIPLAEALQNGFVGQQIYLHGISPSGQDNPQIQGSGSFSATAVTPVAPQVTQEIQNAASFASDVAPGALASIFGVNFGIGTQSSSQVATALPLPNSLNGVSVTVNGITAPAFFASPGQINFQVPYGAAPGVAKVYVVVNGQVSNGGAANVSATAPGIFTYGTNQAVVQNQDYSLNDSSHPAQAGSVATIYLTGLGALDHFIATGAAAPDSPLAHPRVKPTVTIGGMDAPVAFAGMTPGYAGLAQIDVTVPSLATGGYPVVITQGGQTSNGPMMNVTQ